ncbi:hypothetical protein QQ020_26140 [Fulvivirgaceae bacterium BMA12]|uniref:Uncharacterized protein n=1 Tax=Agaribacillus aureus TaxID=3051825 RepID=A0ABT8LCV8_9BACT|nr:hypothetical protein [Fulvivirgaceae bacterium BMA12]
MHQIEPYYSWKKYYSPETDINSPFYGKEYNYDLYSETIYGYYIDPSWDYMGSETLYIKILFVDYAKHFIIIEFIGEWNDALHNDIMHFKRNIVDHFNPLGIKKYILIGENVLNFHGSDDCYYEEWFEDIDEEMDNGSIGWIAAVNFRDFVLEEWGNYNIDTYINAGGSLQINNWRTLNPQHFFGLVNGLISRRISLT